MTVEQFAYKFLDRNTLEPVIVVGPGSPEFWEEYGDQVSIVAWEV